MRFRTCSLFAAFFLAGSLWVGCVQTVKPRDAAERIHLFVTRSPEGTRLVWNTLPGELYSIQFRAQNSRHYEYHPKGINLRAPGDEMTFLDTAPDASTRSYRIHPFPVTGKRISGPPATPP